MRDIYGQTFELEGMSQSSQGGAAGFDPFYDRHSKFQLVGR